MSQIIDKFLNNIINLTKLQISTLEKVDIFSELESKLLNKINEIIPSFDCNKVTYISLMIKFSNKINQNYKHHIDELAIKYQFKIVLISDNQLYIKFTYK